MDEPAKSVSWSDPASVAACVEAHRGLLLAFVERRMSAGLRQRLDPDDIVQEVSLAAVRPPSAAEPAPDRQRDAYGWLCHVAEQRIIDAHRRYFGAAKRDAGREMSLDTATPSPGGESGDLAALIAVSMTTPSQALSRDARESRLQQAIGELPVEQREAVRLRYVESLSTKAIAERLGKSDVAVRVMLSRTVQRLQQLLSTAGG